MRQATARWQVNLIGQATADSRGAGSLSLPLPPPINSRPGPTVAAAPPTHPNLVQLEYKKQLAANLGQDDSARILAFKQKAPAPAEGHENHMASLYTANAGPRPKKAFRAVPQQPDRILDAPDLVDDYYLNLLDWGSNNAVRCWAVCGFGAHCGAVPASCVELDWCTRAATTSL